MIIKTINKTEISEVTHCWVPATGSMLAMEIISLDNKKKWSFDPRDDRHERAESPLHCDVFVLKMQNEWIVKREQKQQRQPKVKDTESSVSRGRGWAVWCMKIRLTRKKCLHTLMKQMCPWFPLRKRKNNMAFPISRRAACTTVNTTILHHVSTRTKEVLLGNSTLAP